MSMLIGVAALTAKMMTTAAAGKAITDSYDRDQQADSRDERD